jgi:hypothetical protein
MANKLKIKRSAVSGKVPLVADLELGELALNTFDGKLYTKKDNGTASVIEIGAGGGGSGTVTSVAASGGTTGLTFTGSPITTTGTLTLGGTLAVANGGTGATTATTARSNLGAAASGANADITSMTAITGGISSPDFVQFDTTATVTPAAGRLYFNDGEGGLSYMLKGGNVVQEVGQSQQVLVYNGTGATLNKGQVVYSNGAQGQRPTVALALATSDATSARTLGIVAESIANGAEGWVTSLGIIENINTSAFTAGAQLYLSGSTAGGLTATKPVAPIHMVYVARCIKSNASSGRLFVTVQNGYELDELHDVSAVSPTNGQTIVYNSTTSLWEKNTVSLTAGVNGTLPIANGGTGSTTAANALTALGAYPATNPNGYTSNTGTVTGVTGTAPIVSSGGTAPAISISAATTSAAGSMSSADKTKLDGIAANANNYVLPKATATALGGVEVFDATVQTVAANAVTTTASRTYGVQLNAADQMVVNVPWANSGGTVTSVAGTGTVSGLTLSGTVTSSGSLTLGGTLAVTASNFASQTANTILAAPNGTAGVPTFRAIVAADIPTLNQNTTGNAATATTLQTARTINGVSFNGSANITVADSTKLPLAGGTMSGAITFAAGQTWPTFNQNTTGTAANVTGTVAAANGGTGLTSPGASGNVLTSTGSGWSSQPPSAGGITYTAVKTSNYTATDSEGVQTNTSGGAFTVTLPATPAVGDQVIIVDTANSWATNNLTVSRNGSTIEGDASDLICNISNVSVQLVYSGTTWNVFAQVGGAGAGVVSVVGGGTGVSTLAANAVVLGNGTSALQTVAPGTSGNVLTSNGTTWTSAAAPSSAVSYPQNIQSGNYTLVLGDAGKQIYSANTGAQTITIPTNASVAFPIGTLVTIVNKGAKRIVLSASGVSIEANGSTSALTAPIIAVGQSVQLMKTGTDAWKATFGAVIENSTTFQYLVIAGGGAGGGNISGGGGGAGGYLTGTTTANAGSTVTVTVGGGGSAVTSGVGNNGTNSSITGVTAAVGGGGGSGTGNGISGGSGGGGGGGYSSTYTTFGGVATSGQGSSGGGTIQGNNYYQSGGGGGAGAGGGTALVTDMGAGGTGLASAITGTSVTRAGGGGGGNIYAPGGAGGAGGGGAGGTGSGGTAGTANTGGGGGGRANGGTSGAGGSGVVILSIPTVDYSGTTTGSPTVTTSGSNTILTFTSSGSYTA